MIVPDNAEYAILKAFEVFEQTSGVPGLDIPGIDVVAIARGYGVQAESAATLDAVEAAFTTALGRSGPSLIRVPIARRGASADVTHGSRQRRSERIRGDGQTGRPVDRR